MTKNIFIPSLYSIFSNNGYSNYNNAYCKSAKHTEYSIEEDAKSYKLEMDLAGVKKEDLDIAVKENVLSISASRKKMIKQENGEEKEEIIYKYEQSFNVNTKSIDIENISANLENGVLTVMLPKKEEIKYEKKIEIA